MQNTLVVQGAIKQEDLSQLIITDSPEEALVAIQKSVSHLKVRPNPPIIT